jgi:ubiquinone/menaquinone biosynthesis C-methylase UbiE
MTKQSASQVSALTRKIYLKQHKNFSKDVVMFNRFVKMVSDPSYFHLPKKAFRDAKILDAGCGNSGYLEIALAKFGTDSITCLDLGKEWIPPLKSVLKENNIPLEVFDFISGSTDKLPFPDNYFDIVFSNGVLMHLTNMKQIERAWRELARVTKSKGHLYILLGCPRGIFEEEIFPAIRRYYRSNKDFKKFVDKQTPATWENILQDIAYSMKKHTNETLPMELFIPLFDLDFCTWVQNVIQVPERYIQELDEKYALAMFKKLGFKKPKRCRRYVERKNIRKFFAPLHYGASTEFSKLLYGPGNLEYIAQKK